MRRATHLVTKRVHRHSKRPCQSKVSELELSSFGEEEVLRFEISVKDSVVVAEGDSLGAREEKTGEGEGRSASRLEKGGKRRGGRRQREGAHSQELIHERLHGVEVESSSLSVGVHVLLQILIAELQMIQDEKVSSCTREAS